MWETDLSYCILRKCLDISFHRLLLEFWKTSYLLATISAQQWFFQSPEISLGILREVHFGSICSYYMVIPSNSVICLKLISGVAWPQSLKIHFLFKLIMMTNDPLSSLNKWTRTNKMSLLSDSWHLKWFTSEKVIYCTSSILGSERRSGEGGF